MGALSVVLAHAHMTDAAPPPKGLTEDMDKPYGHDRTVGWKFGKAELSTVREDIYARRPLLADDTVYFYLLAFAVTKTLRPRDLLILDPLLQAQLRFIGDAGEALDWDNPESMARRAMRDITERLAKRVPGVTHVFVPLIADNHWTLLFYNAREHRWFHYDSLARNAYHLRYARAFLAAIAALDENKGTAKEALSSIKLIEKEQAALATRPSQQAEGWECGFFVIMYAWDIVRSNFTPWLDIPSGQRQASMKSLVVFRDETLVGLLRVVLAIYNQDVAQAAVAPVPSAQGPASAAPKAVLPFDIMF
jgi:hypothetical protein